MASVDLMEVFPTILTTMSAVGNCTDGDNISDKKNNIGNKLAILTGCSKLEKLSSPQSSPLWFAQLHPCNQTEPPGTRIRT